MRVLYRFATAPARECGPNAGWQLSTSVSQQIRQARSRPIRDALGLPRLGPACYTCGVHSYEIVREVLKSTSAKQIASDLGLSLSLVYKWAETPDPNAPSQSYNPLDRVDQLYQSTNDLRLLHWLCERAGGFFIKNPKTTHSHPDYLIPATNQIVQEFADLLSVVSGAASDNAITSEESRSIRKRWEQLKSVTETFVACCEAGNFVALKEVPEVEKP